ncbi:MAG TPA: right-handed parallel beta-helix repeat-containing protein [Polyangiaceae bacterium]|nr:right-handed parallel beta-helix repeat-containing protein [Polyangiaceae bacterium]
MRRRTSPPCFPAVGALGTAAALVALSACGQRKLDAGWDRPAAGGAAGSAGAGASAGAGNRCVNGPGYYVDAASGDDSNDGKSPSTAWQSLTKVNATLFQPGDTLCFRAGASWTGKLAPRGSGTSEAPIAIDQFGSGDKPRIAAGANDDSAVELVNQSYWELNNLDITNRKAFVGDYRGIAVIGQDAGTLRHIQIRRCRVHDVTGEVNWISGSAQQNAEGITFEAGWDVSKRTGGIVFEVRTKTTPPVKTTFDDILIEDNVITDCSFAGIAFKQLDADVHWAIRNTAAESSYSPHTRVVIRNNYLNQRSSSFACNGIYLSSVRDALLEGNVVSEAGTSAIELYYTDAVTVQRNETYGTTMKAGGSQFNGIDAGKGTTNTIIQYNYLHDNGDGLLLSQFLFGDAIVRYNVFQDNTRYQVYLHSDSAASNVIYNNTFYVRSEQARLAYGFGQFLPAEYAFSNNIFVGMGAEPVLTTGGGITYRSNLYFGANVNVPQEDLSAIVADPRFVSPGMGANGNTSGPAFTSLLGYRLSADSPAIDAGVPVADNGGQDFAGNSLYIGAPDLGAYEAR